MAVHDKTEYLYYDLINNAPANNYDLHELIEKGRIELDRMMRQGKDNRVEDVTSWGKQRRNRDRNSGFSYFDNYQSDTPDDVVWFFKAIESLGNYGNLILGYGSLVPSEINKEKYESDKKDQLPLIENIDIEEAKLAPDMIIEDIGKKFRNRLPDGVLFKIGKFCEPREYDSHRRDYCGDKIIGIIILRETKLLFNAFEEATSFYLKRGYLRSEFGLRSFVPDGGPDQNDLLLLAELYNGIYDSFLEHFESPLFLKDNREKIIRQIFGSTSEQVMRFKINYLNQFFQEIWLNIPWTRYMDAIYRVLDPTTENGKKKICYIFPGKKEDRIKQQEEDEAKVKQEYEACTSLSELKAFLKKYLVEFDGARLDKKDRLYEILWGVSDYLEREKLYPSNSKMEMVDSFAYAYSSALKAWKENVLRMQPKDETKSPYFVVLPQNRKRFYSSMDAAIESWVVANSIYERRDAPKTHTEEQTPIVFEEGTNWHDAIYMTLSYYFLYDESIVGIYRFGNENITLNPNRFIYRYSKEKRIEDISLESIIQESRILNGQDEVAKLIKNSQEPVERPE